MTCKDCLHYVPCGGASWEKVTDCPEFTPRSGWVHLPCEVGTPVYVNCSTWGGTLTHCVSKYIEDEPFTLAEVVSVFVTKKQKLIKLKAITKSGGRMFHRYPFSSFGKTVFFTKEEAEKALAERKEK